MRINLAPSALAEVTAPNPELKAQLGHLAQLHHLLLVL